jgi:hypothetical protein
VTDTVRNATSRRFVDTYGAAIQATTSHGWDEPRGEVYLTMTGQDENAGHDPSDFPEGFPDAEIILALTPEQADRLARDLTRVADAARRKPPANCR